jgi:hypothetical protein
MPISGQQTDVQPDAFITQVCGRAAGEQAQRFEQVFTDCGPAPPDATEVVMLSGFMPLLAMSLVQLHKDIQRNYALAFAKQVNDSEGAGASISFPQRTLEYLAAFHKDVTAGSSNTLPALLSAVLEHVFGLSDASVEPCRRGLLEVLVPILRSDVEQFGEIRFAPV